MGDKLVEPRKDVRNLYRGIRLCSTITRGKRRERREEERKKWRSIIRMKKRRQDKITWRYKQGRVAGRFILFFSWRREDEEDEKEGALFFFSFFSGGWDCTAVGYCA